MARKSLEERFWGKVEKSAGCWIWTATKNRQGYGRIRSSGKTARAHRISWELANGPIPDGMDILHRCDNPACVNPAHLFLGTDDDNMRDKENKGRGNHAVGMVHGRSKLTADQVREIRRLYSTGQYLQRELGKRFGVHQTTIGYICRRESWAHIP